MTVSVGSDRILILLVNGAIFVDKILRLPDVIQHTGLARSTIYDRIAKGTFDPGIKLGLRARGWLSSSIQKWIEECAAQSSPDAKQAHGNTEPLQ
jgi:prophage regulatory protein